LSLALNQQVVVALRGRTVGSKEAACGVRRLVAAMVWRGAPGGTANTSSPQVTPLR